ncbi:MAG: efflux RND transporter periplasmic adaptor subunit [Candidatus Cryptobacteroides sp.]
MKNEFARIASALLCIGISALSCSHTGEGSGGQGPEYEVMAIRLSDIELSSAWSASVKGRQDVEIRPQISGLITDVHVAEGQQVRKGQVLFTLDQVAYKAAVETAQAEVEAAEAEVETSSLSAQSKRELYDRGVVSAYDLKTAELALKTSLARLSQSRARLVNAENDLSYTLVKSPSDGVVGTLPYRIGSLVSPSIATALTTVSDNSQMYVYFSLPESRVLRMTQEYGSLGSTVAAMPPVRLRLSTGSIYPHDGRIESISGVIDRNTGSVSVRAVFPNEERTLLSGCSGSIIIPESLEKVIVIPQSATYELQDRKFVYKVVDNVAVASEISVHPANDGKNYVVTSGLIPSDVIVTEGVGLLKDGTAICPVWNK